MKYIRYLLVIPFAFLLLFANLNTASAKQAEINQQDINQVIYTYMSQQYLSLKDSKVSDFSNVVQDKYLLDTVTDITKYKVDFNPEISKRLLDYKLNISNIETKLTGKKVIAHILSTADLTYQKDNLEPYSFIEEREHIIILENIKGDWKITKDIYDELGSPDESFINDSNYNKEMYEAFLNNKISVKEKAKVAKKIQESLKASTIKTSVIKTIAETDKKVVFSPMISSLDILNS